LEELPLTRKFSKFGSERSRGDTDRRVVFKFREIWLTEIGKIVHIRCALESESNIRLKPSFEPNKYHPDDDDDDINDSFNLNVNTDITY